MNKKWKYTNCLTRHSEDCYGESRALFPQGNSLFTADNICQVGEYNYVELMKIRQQYPVRDVILVEKGNVAIRCMPSGMQLAFCNSVAFLRNAGIRGGCNFLPRYIPYGNQVIKWETTDYCAGGHIVYENGVLKYILNPEGYATKQLSGTYVAKGRDGKISIVGNGGSLTVHEITHVRQSLDAGRLDFNSNKKLQYISLNITIQANQEVEAYQRQFSIKRTDLSTGLNLRNPNEITPQVVGKMRWPNGTFKYPAIHNRYFRNQ